MNQNVYDWLDQRNAMISEPKLTDGDNLIRVITGVVGFGVGLMFLFGAIVGVVFVEDRDVMAFGFGVLLSLGILSMSGLQFMPGRRKKVWENRKFRFGDAKFDQTILQETAGAIEGYDTKVGGFTIRTNVSYRGLVKRFGQDVADCLILTGAVRRYKNSWQLTREVVKLLKKPAGF